MLIDRVSALLQWTPQQMPASDGDLHRGPKRKLQDWQLQLGLIIHLLQPIGTLAQCVHQHLRLSLSDAALSLRRQKMKLQPFLKFFSSRCSAMSFLSKSISTSRPAGWPRLRAIH